VHKFLNLLVSGVVSGAIYSILGAGLTLTYSTTGVFAFGYGAVAFSSAFLYYELQTGLHWHIVVAALVVVLVFAPLLGYLLNRLIFRSLTKANDSSKIMAAVGVLIFVPATLQFIIHLLISVGHFNIPDGSLVFLAPGIGPSPPDQWHVGSVFDLNSDQLIVFITAIIMGVGLWYILRRTPLGLRMRATVDRPELAMLRGVDRDKMSSTAWMLGTTMAAIVGVVGAPIFNSLSPNTYTLVMFVATAGVVLGGLRSIPLAVTGGLLIGALQNLVAGYAGFAKNIPGFGDAVPFVLLLIGLGIWGQGRARRAGTSAEDVPPPDYQSLLPPWRRIAPWIFWFAVLFIYLFFVADRYWIGLTTQGLALSLVFLSFVIVTGIGGIVSLAQAAFVTASGLTAGLLIGHFHQSFYVGLLGGIVVAMLLGALVALPSIRLGGLSIALATLALGYLADNVLFQWSWLAGQLQEGWAIPRPSLGPIHTSSDKTLAVVLAVIVIIVTLLIRNLQKSPTGRMMIAVRSSEPGAASSGISGFSMKLTLFAVSAALAGLGGVLLVTYDQHVTDTTYVTQIGLVWLATVVLWGVRRPAAAIAGGLGSSLFPGFLSSGFHFSFISWSGTTSIYLPSMLFGLGAIQMAKNPDGILGDIAEQNHKRRRKRAAKRAARDKVALTALPVADPALGATALGATALGATALGATGAGVLNGAGERVAPSPARARPKEGALLTLDAVSAAYGDVEVLFGVDLALSPGTITALVGANGAGKSTLCRVISGLMAPTAGRIHLGGVDVTAQPAYRRAKDLLLAPESRGIFPGLSVEENLTLRLPSSAERDRAYERFPVLGARRKIPAGNLSGGEQQMLTMAPVMVRPPQILVADEPTLGLAPLIVAEIMNVFKELRDQGVTLLIVEERAKAVLDVADDVALLELGRIVWAGPRPELDADMLTAIYLGQSKVEGATLKGAPG
jgi:ABC-type branched-subunit amino acid transport system ATPase component/branched-subunit amino acid ABC-type transport system permease component